MEPRRKQARYQRLYEQAAELLTRSSDREARMATLVALLHHKIEYFFWTGFYLLKSGDLVVHSYQGPLACQVLERHKGVCWAAIDRGETIVVPDVELFPGHIACDSRSQSEIALPVRDSSGMIIGVLDVDSSEKNSFDDVDAEELGKLLTLLAL